MLLAATLLSCAALAASQPVSCEEDSNCFDGHYCDTALYVCQECLSCTDLKREPRPLHVPCIKSIRDCGPCLEGLVEDRRGELTCVVPSAGGGEGGAGGWIAAGLGIALLVAVLAALVIRYILNHSDIFKFKVDTNIDATLPPVQFVAPSAPDSPPPYSPPRPPDQLPPFTTREETSDPLIKPYQPPVAPFESLSDRQNVSVFNPPAYVRLPNGSHPSDGRTNTNDNCAPLIHDEDTSPSTWTPGASYTDVNGNSAVNGVTNTQPPDGPTDLSAALAMARNTDVIQPPPLTLRTQLLNGNDEASSEGESYSAHAAGPSRPTNNGNYNVMNVNQVITIIKPQL